MEDSDLKALWDASAAHPDPERHYLLEALKRFEVFQCTMRLNYFAPDAPSVLNPYPFIWQFDDAPQATPKKLPRLHLFLDFWSREIEATIESIELAMAGPVAREITFTSESDLLQKVRAGPLLMPGNTRLQ